MEIILKEDIIGLGYKNDIVNVKSGYGRNYLIPQGKGVIASESAKKILAENLKQQAHKLAALKAEAEKKAQALEGVKLVITAKVSATGATYGSVNKNTVADELQKKGFDVDRKIITMHDIKSVGEYEASDTFQTSSSFMMRRPFSRVSAAQALRAITSGWYFLMVAATSSYQMVSPAR